MSHRINSIRKIKANLILELLDKNREKNILKKICFGKGADIGCGSDKISSNCIGVDLFGKGEIGKFGCENKKKSHADIKASGDELPFKNNELDFIVAKHNLEHYDNPEKTLIEWKRVLKKGGKIGVIVPDDKYVNTKKLDPTHYSKFTMKPLEELFKKVGFKILGKGYALKKWSIYLIAEK